jgi:tRNA-Thr(GGU) m(6)t(6)A37 methyltransferase TsaA
MTHQRKRSETAIITFHPIGHVERERSDRELSGNELRASPARIVIEPEFTDALLGLGPGSDIVVVFYFHLPTPDALQVHPRGDRSQPLHGVFATRSQIRPNPIGVTTVRIQRIEQNVLEVIGLDALDGSPVLDIKSYAATFSTPYEKGDNV